MLVDLKTLISNMIKDTDSIMYKECNFCGKKLKINDFSWAYVNSDIINDATYCERCNCKEASEIWLKYDLIIETQKQREMLLDKVKHLFKNNNLGKRQLDSTFENYKITEQNNQIYKNVKKYVDKLLQNKTNNGLFITGTYGVGKTYLASCIANELIKNNIPVVFGTLIQLLGYIKETYRDTNISDTEYINLYSNVDLLIIDDLGKEKPTEWVLEKLFLIVNNRYNNYLPIVITTNYNRKELRERLCVNKNYSIYSKK